MSAKFGALADYVGFSCPAALREKKFRSVFLYDGSVAFHEAALCICKKSDLPISAPLLLCCDEAEGVPCCDGTKTPAELLTICCEYLLNHSRIDDGCAQLSGALLSGKGLHHIISVASRVLHNPVILADQSFRVLACGGSEAFSDQFLHRIVEDGYYPESYIKQAIRHTGVISSSVEVMPPITSEPFSPMRYMTMELMVKNKHVGFATVVEETPFLEGDSMLFSYLCRVFVTELRDTDPNAYGSMRDCDYILMELLEGMLQGHRLDARLLQSGLDFGEPKRLLVIKQRGQVATQRKHEYYIGEYRAVLRQCPCVLFQSSIVCLIDDSLLDALLNSVPAIKTLLEYSNYVCGISRKATDPSQLPGHYNEASLAITYGESLKDLGPFYTYGKYCFYHMLSLVDGDAPLHQFCSPKYLELLRYDRENNTSYGETLAAYVECGQSSLRTADVMRVHRNTVIYRLRRLEEQFGFHLDNADEIFSVHMSMKILKYRKNAGSED